jgi:hypothetical protein
MGVAGLVLAWAFVDMTPEAAAQDCGRAAKKF